MFVKSTFNISLPPQLLRIVRHVSLGNRSIEWKKNTLKYCWLLFYCFGYVTTCWNEIWWWDHALHFSPSLLRVYRRFSHSSWSKIKQNLISTLEMWSSNFIYCLGEARKMTMNNWGFTMEIELMFDALFRFFQSLS